MIWFSMSDSSQLFFCGAFLIFFFQMRFQQKERGNEEEEDKEEEEEEYDISEYDMALAVGLTDRQLTKL